MLDCSTTYTEYEVVETSGAVIEGAGAIPEALVTGLAKGSIHIARAWNVDYPTYAREEEFIKLIIYQRGYQANSRVITTSDQITLEALQLKQ
mgnify:CR=1 FL=1